MLEGGAGGEAGTFAFGGVSVFGAGPTPLSLATVGAPALAEGSGVGPLSLAQAARMIRPSVASRMVLISWC